VSTYAIGDLQGCFDEFKALLDAIEFDSARDSLWLLGDLVNRGPSSLATLRFIRKLGDSAKVVLGNHDLHFLAVFYGGHDTRRADTLDELLSAPDVEELAAWLRAQPLIHVDEDLGWLMVHAGVPPLWSREELIELAAEAREFYAGQNGADFFAGMYGNSPVRWNKKLVGLERIRCVVNYLTRMRLVAIDGTLDFASKGAPNDLPAGFSPWFMQERFGALGLSIAFGHWAALEGDTSFKGSQSVTGANDKTEGFLPRVAALDTGCVWGRELTALCLETGSRTSVSAGTEP